jgi:lipopolysaccharide biosynthesis protein
VRALKRILPHVTTSGDQAVLIRTDRLAVIASYAPDLRVSRSLATLVAEFEANGYRVMLVRASEATSPLLWPNESTPPTFVINKPNVGYDFGSWATALAVVPELADKPYVILANDSLLGPFESIAPLIDDFESSPADVWGATDTLEYLPHLQSYLLGFKAGALKTRAVRSFWRNIRDIDDKDAIVVRYEIGLSRLLTTEGFVSRPWFSHQRIVPEGGNPTTIGGSRLLDAGFPFVKRILIENPGVFPDAAVAAERVMTKYGEHAADWK